MKEIIICSAVKTTCGRIIRGHRHADCIYSILQRKLKPLSGFYSQGFITSKNRYVNRYEAFKIQKKAGIKSVWTGKQVEDLLFSEDLY